MSMPIPEMTALIARIPEPERSRIRDYIRKVEADNERLTAQLNQSRKEANEAEREFAREARDIAAEARWSAQADADGLPYGTY